MNTQQPSSGDLKDLVHQHKQEQKRASPPSLLERRQCNNKEEENLGSISPMPVGAERMAALRDLGATFEEGKKTIAKVATPTETIVPSFVDSDQLEKILYEKEARSDENLNH